VFLRNKMVLFWAVVAGFFGFGVEKVLLHILDSLPSKVYDWFSVHDTLFLGVLGPVLLAGVVGVGLLIYGGSKTLVAEPRNWKAVLRFIVAALVSAVIVTMLYRLVMIALMIVVYRLVGLS